MYEVKIMGFILGCNYWASNAGADMWRNFDIDTIEKDLKTHSSHGVEYLRVFPNWRDFQPVMPVFSAMGNLVEYHLENDHLPTNPYYLNQKVMDEFSQFLTLCEKYKIKLIVGLITGWMSGRLYIPSALYGKNVLTDPLALYFEQLFIKGFVSHFKASEAIYAWDLGNECNCMGKVTREQAANWTATIYNAIKSADSSRMVVSGMHGLQTEHTKPWNFADHSEFVDMLTTHPYPYWGDNTRIDENLAFRTALYPTAQTKFYSDLGHKPCLAEELGTMGAMLCNDQNSAHFMRLNMFSLWANNTEGVMWWCNSDQTELKNHPYSENMVELELGLTDKTVSPKPVLKEIKNFREFLNSLPFELPKAQADAVCLLTKGQDQWGVGYMTYLLLKKSGLNCSFAYACNDLPESKLYLLPSISSDFVLKNEVYKQLKQKGKDGADLYISINDGVLCEFEEFSGLEPQDYFESACASTVKIGDTQIDFTRGRTYILKPTTAQVIATDKDGNPFITVNNYGKGRVFVVNAAVENSLITCHDFEKTNYDAIYKQIFASYIEKQPLENLPNGVTATYHKAGDDIIAVIINHTDKEISADIKYNEAFYGNPKVLKPFDAAVIKL